jgi:hypothetical protein
VLSHPGEVARRYQWEVTVDHAPGTPRSRDGGGGTVESAAARFCDDGDPEVCRPLVDGLGGCRDGNGETRFSTSGDEALGDSTGERGSPIGGEAPTQPTFRRVEILERNAEDRSHVAAKAR